MDEIKIDQLAKKSWNVTKAFLKKAAVLSRDYAALLKPLTKRQQFKLRKVRPYLEKSEFQKLVGAIKQGKADIELKRYGWSFLISGKDLLPKLSSELKDIQELDKKIGKVYFAARFEEFSERAWGAIPQYIAPSIIGQLHAKQAAALQLFSPEQFHILLFGLPESGRSEILKSTAKLAPISSLCSPDENLAFRLKGKKALPGPLPLAHNGVCCVDDLQLVQQNNLRAIKAAMDKRIISHRKNKFSAKVNLLAASDKADFGPKFLSKFHLIFSLKKVSLRKFADIAEKLIVEERVPINRSDILFIKKYIKRAKKLDVKLPRALGKKVKAFLMTLKAKEDKLLFKITPRTIKGVLQLIKASARMELRQEIQSKDLARVFEIVKRAAES